MIREPRNNFDEHIKEALQGFEMPFEPDDWALMEQKLDKEAGQAGFLLFFSNKYLPVGIAAALLLCVLYHTNRWLSNTNVDLAQHRQTTLSDASITSNQTAKTLDLSEEMTRLADDKNMTMGDMTTTASTTNDVALADENAHANTHLSENKQNAAFFDISPSEKAKTNNTITAYDKKNTIDITHELNAAKNTGNFEQFAAATNAIATNQPTSQTASFQNLPIKNHFTYQNTASLIENTTAVSKHDIFSENGTATHSLTEKAIEKSQIFPLTNKKVTFVEENNRLLTTIETAQTLSDFSSVVKTPKVPKKKSEIAIGSYLSTDINFLEASFPELGLTTGLGLQFGKNKRWGFQTGLFYTYKNYPTANFVEETAILNDFLVTNNEINYNINSSRAVTIEERYDLFSIRAFFLEIPLLVTHNFKPKAAINPYLAAGMSVWLPTSLQKTNYKSQTIATYDYVAALQDINERDPSFMITNDITTSIGTDTIIIDNGTDIEENTNYINTIPDYYTAINEEAVNQTVGKSRAYWDIFQIQAGLDVKMSKRWSFQLAGQLKGSLFKHALNRDAIQHLPSVDKRLHTIGIQAGLTCTL